ncbi:MAG: zinc-ribbon domain-containing protein [Myxococcales bacterium]
MIKVKCDACGAPYEVDPRRVPKSGLKMRCPACGSSVQVNADGAAPAQKADGNAPAPKPAAAIPAGPAKPAKLAGDFDLDLPAVKGALPKPFSAPTAAAASPFGTGFESTDVLDLPAVKGSQPKPAGRPLAITLGDDLDVTDLPAPKPGGARSGVPAPQASSASRPIAPDLDFDLPAPKKPAAAPIAPELDFDLPAPKRPAAIAPDLDFDLPAPKRPAAAAIAPDLDFDLPAPKKPAAAAIAPDLDFDLPAPKKPAAAAIAPDLDFDLPTPKRPGGLGADFDLPQPKSRALPGKPEPVRAQPQPFAPARPAPAAASNAASTMAKDSLAIDPEPFYADDSSDLLGHLDDVRTAAALKQEAPQIDLPAPSDLPKVKGPTGAARTQGAPSPFGKLGRDSLDLPGGFAEGELDLPAPADLPVALDLPVGRKPAAGPGGVFKNAAPALDKPVSKAAAGSGGRANELARAPEFESAAARTRQRQGQASRRTGKVGSHQRGRRHALAAVLE